MIPMEIKLNKNALDCSRGSAKSAVIISFVPQSCRTHVANSVATGEKDGVNLGAKTNSATERSRKKKLFLIEHAF